MDKRELLTNKHFCVWEWSIFHAYVVKRHTFNFWAAVSVYDPSFFVVDFCRICKITQLHIWRGWWESDGSQTIQNSTHEPGEPVQGSCPDAALSCRVQAGVKAAEDRDLWRTKSRGTVVMSSLHRSHNIVSSKSPEWESVIQS